MILSLFLVSSFGRFLYYTWANTGYWDLRGSITGINTVLPPVVVIPGIGGGLRERSTLRAAEGARTCDAPIAQATHVGSTAAALRIRADPTDTHGGCDGQHALPPENAPGNSHCASPAGRTQVRCDT